MGRPNKKFWKNLWRNFKKNNNNSKEIIIINMILKQREIIMNKKWITILSYNPCLLPRAAVVSISKCLKKKSNHKRKSRGKWVSTTFSLAIAQMLKITTKGRIAVISTNIVSNTFHPNSNKIINSKTILKTTETLKNKQVTQMKQNKNTKIKL